MKQIIYFTLLTTLFFGCKKELKDGSDDKILANQQANNKGDNGNNATGFIYTSTNSSSGNTIIALEKHRDGSVEENR